MKDLPLIDDSEIFGGRDKRLILKNQPDDQIDLILNQWAIDKGYSYHDAVGIALKDWLLAILENAKGYEHSLEKLKHNITSNILLHYCMETIEALPLVSMGFKSPATKHALQHAVRRFLKKHGALAK